MKTEYAESDGFLQRDSVEHEEYAEAYSAECQKVEERDGAEPLEKMPGRDKFNRAFKRVKDNKGASGVAENKSREPKEIGNARMAGIPKR